MSITWEACDKHVCVCARVCVPVCVCAVHAVCTCMSMRRCFAVCDLCTRAVCHGHCTQCVHCFTSATGLYSCPVCIKVASARKQYSVQLTGALTAAPVAFKAFMRHRERCHMPTGCCTQAQAAEGLCAACASQNVPEYARQETTHRSP